MAKKQQEENQEEKSKTQIILDKLNKDFGAGTVARLGDNKKIGKVDAVSTGSLKLDLATGIGGLPKGRVIEFSGWESSGKTTAAHHVIAEVQKTGKKAAIIDYEHTLDRDYAAKVGVDIEELIVSQPDYAEQGLAVAEGLCQTGDFGVIVFDSVAAMVPKKELEGDFGDSSIGLQARLMGQAFRKLTGLAEKTGTILIFINQLREKIGVMFGTPETTSGGNALKFYASMRLDFRKSINLEGESNTTTIKITKNKVAPPFHKIKIDVIWGKGYYTEKELLELAVDMEVVKKAGAGWYTIGETKIQGDIDMLQMLSDNPEFMQDIKNQVIKKIEDGYELPRELKETKEK